MSRLTIVPFCVVPRSTHAGCGWPAGGAFAAGTGTMPSAERDMSEDTGRWTGIGAIVAIAAGAAGVAGVDEMGVDGVGVDVRVVGVDDAGGRGAGWEEACGGASCSTGTLLGVRDIGVPLRPDVDAVEVEGGVYDE